jgi:uncharacterized protein (UPF0332 family)
MSKLLARAKPAAGSARTLLEAGDNIGAVNRAYYAMFDAARAALAEIDPQLLETKHHATLIRRFGKHAVQDWGFDRALGRAFSQTEDARIAADYEVELIDRSTARKAVALAEKFVTAVEQFIGQVKT